LSRKIEEYKTKWYGSKFIIAPPFYPSSKRCSSCGVVKQILPLNNRVYQCEACGLVIDRELNASKNLVSVAAGLAETKNACYEVGGYSSSEQCPPMRQEPNKESF
jgi:putative transposase